MPGSSSKNLTFPFTMRQEIPLWTNFASIPYHNITKFGDRARPVKVIVGSAANIKISLPFNGKFDNLSNVNYEGNANVISQLITGGGGLQNNENIRIRGISQLLEEDKRSGNMILPKTVKEGENTQSQNVYLSVDQMDIMFTGAGHKQYSFEIDMICKSAADSNSAAKICNVFSSRCWPLIKVVAENPKMKHPDVWGIWISKNPASLSEIEGGASLWYDGYGPQLCVLTDVLTQRVSGENSRILAISHAVENDAPFVPLHYKVALEFTELEPSIQSPNSSGNGIYTTVNRSTAQANSRSSGGSSTPS